ncbi:MAG: hypothetical protein OXD32_07160 [Endozoicomonadaceae bacterium]|nr:hypothetical protein [Endozoicomonadaceae bacterium]
MENLSNLRKRKYFSAATMTLYSIRYQNIISFPATVAEADVVP